MNGLWLYCACYGSENSKRIRRKYLVLSAKKCEIIVEPGCSECPENSQIIPVCFVIICLLALFHLCTLAEVLFFKRPSLLVLYFYHCINFFIVILSPRESNHSSQLHKNFHLCLMNVIILLKIFFLPSVYLAHT